MSNLAISRERGNAHVTSGPRLVTVRDVVLREYQLAGVNAVRESFQRGARSVLLVAPTGAGKGTVATYVMVSTARKGNRCIFIVHRREIIRDVHARVSASGVRCGMLLPGEPEDPEALIQIASIQTLFARGHRPPAELVFWDECFPAGTLVDGRPIETILPGESVLSFDHDIGRLVKRRVLHRFVSAPSAMVRLTLEDGQQLCCTAGHPFYTPRGYVPAVDLHVGEELVRYVPGNLGAGLGGPGWSRPRVARVEVLERGPDGTFGGVCPDGLVYNLEVEVSHTYFAEGILVHNCHHCTAASYRAVREAYPKAKHLGASATPMRADRSALGDVFEEMIVIAKTSELMAQGFLVPCTTFYPDHSLGENLAQDPVHAYLAHGEGKRAFVFTDRKVIASQIARSFMAAGIAAVDINGDTPDVTRRLQLSLFKQGQIRVIVNVSTMTEGVDVPEAKVCILAKKCATPAVYLQAGGRILRPAEGEGNAILIDLCGNMHIHGLLGDDREFSLEGRAISNVEKDRPDNEPMACPGCGGFVRPLHIVESGAGCPACGYKKEPKPMAEILGETLHVHRGEQLSLPLGGA